MERTVEPVGLVLKGDVWYVYAYCRMRRDYRIFRLSRIHRLTVRDETFERKAVTLEQIDERWYQMDPPSSFIRLVLRFSPEVRVRVEDFFGMDRIREMEDDSLIVTFRCPEGPWTYEMLLKFGTHVEVLEPAHVRHKLRETALQIARKYGTE